MVFKIISNFIYFNISVNCYMKFMKNNIRIFILCLFYALLLNVFDIDIHKNTLCSFQNEQHYSFCLISENPVNTNIVFDVSSDDDCFDEYIVKDLSYYNYFNSQLSFFYKIIIPQTINLNVWHPPQVS